VLNLNPHPFKNRGVRHPKAVEWRPFANMALLRLGAVDEVGRLGCGGRLGGILRTYT